MTGKESDNAAKVANKVDDAYDAAKAAAKAIGYAGIGFLGGLAVDIFAGDDIGEFAEEIFYD